jgi:hypothetical protein
MHLTADATVDQEDDIQDPSLTKKAQTQPEKTKNNHPVIKKIKRKNEEENHDVDGDVEGQPVTEK